MIQREYALLDMAEGQPEELVIVSRDDLDEALAVLEAARVVEQGTYADVQHRENQIMALKQSWLDERTENDAVPVTLL